MESVSKQLNDFFSSLKMQEPQVYKDLIVVPITGKTVDYSYILLDKAMEQQLVRITELKDGAQVPYVTVENLSPHRVLLMSGEQITGAKQNRAINVHIMLSPESMTKIPVSCTEQGRWQQQSRTFNPAHWHLSKNIKSNLVNTVYQNYSKIKSLASDQRKVWHDIQKCYVSLQDRGHINPSSWTSSFVEIASSQSDSVAKYLDDFKLVEDQIGFVVFLNGRIVGMELITNSNHFKALHEKWLSSYALDALNRKTNQSDQQDNPWTLSYDSKLVKELAHKYLVRSRSPQLIESPGIGQLYGYDSAGSLLSADENILLVTE